MKGLVLGHRVDEGAVLRLRPEIVQLVDAICERVSDDPQMVEFLTQLREMRGETMLIEKKPVRVLYNFPPYVQIYRKNIDRRIQEKGVAS